MQVKINMPVLEARKCRGRQAGVAQGYPGTRRRSLRVDSSAHAPYSGAMEVQLTPDQEAFVRQAVAWWGGVASNESYLSRRSGLGF